MLIWLRGVKGKNHVRVLFNIFFTLVLGEGWETGTWEILLNPQPVISMMCPGRCAKVALLISP